MEESIGKYGSRAVVSISLAERVLVAHSLDDSSLKEGEKVQEREKSREGSTVCT